MPIRPIDMISIAPRSQEASQQHVNDQNRLTHAHDAAAQQFGKLVKDNAEVVVHASPTEKNEYRYDAKEKGNGSYHGSQKKGKSKSKDNKGKEKENTIKQSSFDIKI